MLELILAYTLTSNIPILPNLLQVLVLVQYDGPICLRSQLMVNIFDAIAISIDKNTINI